MHLKIAPMTSKLCLWRLMTQMLWRINKVRGLRLKWSAGPPFFPLWQINFDPLKNGLKIFISKTCIFFIRNLRALHLFFAGTYIRIWGHLYSACIALQLYSALRFERLKRVQKSRAIPWEFWDEVFSLSMPSVCPRLTTVYLRNWNKLKSLLLNIWRLKFSLVVMLISLLKYFRDCHTSGVCSLLQLYNIWTYEQLPRFCFTIM